MSDSINRLYNCSNPYQGDYKRVLCVCSAGLLRSPTAAVVLASKPFNYNTRAAGLDGGHALVPVDGVLIAWAQEIVCMNEAQQKELKKRTDKPVINLNIPDTFAYRDPRLIALIKKNYSKEVTNAQTTDNEASSSERVADSDQTEPEGC